MTVQHPPAGCRAREDDRIRYLHRLTIGEKRNEKRNPSTETLVKVAFALVASEEQFRGDPRLTLVLSEFLLAAGYTAAATAASRSSASPHRAGVARSRGAGRRP
jgi:hypothetical protein